MGIRLTDVTRTETQHSWTGTLNHPAQYWGCCFWIWIAGVGLSLGTPVLVFS